MTLQCNACGATYTPELADGTLYFHACAPLSSAELAAAVAAGKVQLPPGETADEATKRRTYERWNKRDENVVPNPDPTQPATMKSVGAGVTPVLVAPNPSTSPVVIVGP
jgi:hypothetical protein